MPEGEKPEQPKDRMARFKYEFERFLAENGNRPGTPGFMALYDLRDEIRIGIHRLGGYLHMPQTKEDEERYKQEAVQRQRLLDERIAERESRIPGYHKCRGSVLNLNYNYGISFEQEHLGLYYDTDQKREEYDRSPKKKAEVRKYSYIELNTVLNVIDRVLDKP